MPRKKKTTAKANPMDEALRESLHRVLKRNADKWPKEAPDLRRWIDKEKPNFSNLREAFLADKTPEDLAELFPTGQKGLDELLKYHQDAIGAAVDAFPDGYDAEPPPPRLRPRESSMGDLRPAMLFSVLPFPAGEVPAKDNLFNNLCFYPTNAANLSFYPVFSSRGPEDYNAPELEDGLPLPTAEAAEKIRAAEPQTEADRLLWTLANGEVVLVPHELFPSKNWLDYITYAWLAEKRDWMQAVEMEVRPIAAVQGEEEKTGLHYVDLYTPMPRGIEGASAMGGPIAIADPVEVNGEEYANEPALVADAAGRTLLIQPRGTDVVPEEWLANPRQLKLELRLDPTNAPAFQEYLIETATKTTALAKFTDICPKILPYMFACAPMSSRGVKGTLEEMTEWLVPTYHQRRRKKRDLEMVGTGFVAMKSLRALERKPNGVLHPYDLFNLDYDLSKAADADVGWCVNPWLAKRMQGGTGGGFFLLNMSRWRHLPINNPRIFPLILRLAAYHDKARVNGGSVYQPQRLEWIDADRLAYECNTLSEGAAMYRTGKTDASTARQQLATARAKLEADLDMLKERGFLGNWKKEKVYGKGFRLLPVAPDDYAEACRNAAHKVRENKSKKKAGKKGGLES